MRRNSSSAENLLRTFTETTRQSILIHRSSELFRNGSQDLLAGNLYQASRKAARCRTVPSAKNLCILAERKFSLGKDWHSACLRCEKCNKTLAPGSHAEHEGKPYCHQPCYSAMFGPGGYGRGGAESYVYKK
ncbi:unnamed protein product [Acanthoscelides obtectus]|uniref:LIM zinc-binding domain-containing protein n=1 Tax=Acanthoscelides obtectus TaxID=200917 RepID=A0A9P0K3P1_ACAOB|nr:unnamed protein product [Acanthoscelides obtectus]CAK1657072.1 Cysteine-rich protein 1 [Acanthoscelides obtectus]